MTSPHIAHTVEDVRRLAPTEGFYWFRAADQSAPSRWNVAALDLDRGREWLIPGIDGWVGDDFFLGGEIIGPIPEPGT